MFEGAELLISLGGILLLGLITSEVGRRTPLPRVTLLLLFGVLIGEQGMQLVPHAVTKHFELIASMTLLMVGFLLGGKLTVNSVRKTAGKILSISIAEALVTCSLVTLVLYALGAPFALALILGCIASASAPAAVYDVIAELNSQSRFSRLLLAVVAMDDVWALLIFGIGLAMVSSLSAGNEVAPFVIATRELFGAVFLGLMIGLPAAFLTGRIRTGQPMLLEALGIVFLCGGLAMWFEVSFLLAAIVCGAVIANLATHHEYPFHAIEDIEWPFMIVFFVLAGATLELDSLAAVGLLGFVYIIARSSGKLAGAYWGATISHADPLTRKWIGAALLPQAGVNIGMALVAAHRMPEYRDTLLMITIGSTVFFELFGPILTRVAVKKTEQQDD